MIPLPCWSSVWLQEPLPLPWFLLNSAEYVYWEVFLHTASRIHVSLLKALIDFSRNSQIPECSVEGQRRKRSSACVSLKVKEMGGKENHSFCFQAVHCIMSRELRDSSYCGVLRPNITVSYLPTSALGCICLSVLVSCVLRVFCLLSPEDQCSRIFFSTESEFGLSNLWGNFP